MKIITALVLGLLMTSVAYATTIITDSLQTDFMKCYNASDGKGNNEMVCVQN